MMRGLAAGLMVLACAGTTVGNGQEPEVPDATEAHGGFGLPDEAGTRLIVMSDLSRPDALGRALCSGGERVAARFTTQQAAGDFNGRETARNFDRLPGKVYALDERVDPDSICFVASPSLLTGARIASVTAVSNGPGGCQARRRLAQARARAVVHCYPIALVDGRIHIVLVEFERRGSNALASIVLLDGVRAIFDDHEAEYRGPGDDLWRADDGGVLTRDGFTVIAALHRADQWMLAVNWQGPEGASMSFVVSDGASRFTTVVRDYWYQAPL